MTERLLIVGSGMATARLLEELTEREYGGEITVVGEEQQASYNRILLSSILAGDKSLVDIPLLDADWYQDRGVSLITGQRIEAIDLANREACTASGDRYKFDRLVFATGSRAHIPDIEGVNAPGVMGFRSIADLDTIRSSVKPGANVAIVGGGLLGLEAAHGINSLGARVTVVHRQPHLMNRQLDAQAARLLQRQLEARGIDFVLGVSPERVLCENHSAAGLQLENEQAVSASLVLFAAGIDPNKELAERAGLACDRAIIADEHLRTSVPGVYALGECCQINGRTFGLVAPVNQQAEVLARNLTGQYSPGYHWENAPTQLKVSGIDLFSAGDLPFPEDTRSQVLTDEAQGLYRRLVFRDSQLVGAILLGDRTGGLWYSSLIDSGMDVSAYGASLMFGEVYCKAS